jgi:hypothetical protein
MGSLLKRPWAVKSNLIRLFIKSPSYGMTAGQRSTIFDCLLRGVLAAVSKRRRSRRDSSGVRQFRRRVGEAE